MTQFQRIGMGLDVHPLVEGRKLILGGVKIPYSKGLLGHSDADVLIHAICDAILGAISEGDLGRHFPDTDAQYRNISSMILLRKVIEKVKAKGFRIVNMDATVAAQGPGLAEYIPRMIDKMGDALGVGTDRINIKATSPEGLGFLGRGEGIMAQSVVLVEEMEEEDPDVEGL
ncbi:MAG: 2-C-methyl-D-erythritol 2,4-cyclodiphosphate synthase [Syntrophobacterales bacterium]|nr:MAG: 2-C-methyl-D-erythritol 2,4-cyclodiphosphate synthase [Syntrophobacterales bacterium]